MDLTALLAAREDLILERLPDGRFVRRGIMPAWCSSLPSEPLRTEKPFKLDEVFPFLSAFLEQVGDAWDATTTHISSNFWTRMSASGEEIHLEATAVHTGDAEALVISRNERLFDRQQLLLQRARELRLTHDALMKEGELKDILVHAIVHDLAAPLHSILGALSLLLERGLDEVSTRWVRIALDAATRQRELIRDILHTFSAEYSALTRHPDASPGDDVANLGDVIQRVTFELEPIARRRRVRLLAPDFANTPCPVVADGRRLVRVLINLVDNALRFSPPGGDVTLRVSRDAKTVTASVDDDGPGVPIEVLPKLFQKFAHGGTGASRTGLGLYFCRITVERWGGGIGYSLREGGGARFWIRLMIADGCSLPFQEITEGEDG